MKFVTVRIDAIHDEMLASRFNGRGRNIDARHSGFAARQSGVDGESPGIAETIQDALRPRILTQCLAFITLIEKEAGFLTLPGVYHKQHAVLPHGHPRRDATCYDKRLFYFQSFAAARLAIIAHENATRPRLFDQCIDY